MVSGAKILLLFSVVPQLLVPSDAVADEFRSGVDKWEKCATNINLISDQCGCAICGAHAAVGTISNRRCIAHLEKRLGLQPLPDDQISEQISADQAAGCFAYPDKRSPIHNCNPLAPDPILPAIGPNDVFLEAVFKGIVTGKNVYKPASDYVPDDGCVPYRPEKRLDEVIVEKKLECQVGPDKDSKCTNPTYVIKGDYKSDLAKGKIESYLHFQRIEGESANDMVKLMMTEIEVNGPITTNMNAFDDVDAFAQAKVILKDHGLPIRKVNHVVRIIGWGYCNRLIGLLHVGQTAVEKELAIKSKSKTATATTKCWIVANSWGSQRLVNPTDSNGQKIMTHREPREVHNAGFLLVETGSNVLNIEVDITAPIVVLSDADCKRSTFKTGPIEAVSWRDVRRPEAGFLLHQGSCTVPVKVAFSRANGKAAFTITADGIAQHTQKIMVGAPEKIVMSEISPNMILGEGAACEPVNGNDPRQACRFLARDLLRSSSSYKDAYKTTSVLNLKTNVVQTWSYAPAKPAVGSTPKTDAEFFIKTKGFFPEKHDIKGKTLDAMNVGKVNSLLTLDGETVLVFGTDKRNDNNFIAFIVGNADHDKFTVEAFQVISEPVTQASIFVGFD